MAKLTDAGIPKVTTLADDDLIYAVDISDTTDDPAGSSVGITKSDFQAGLGGGGGGETKTRSVLTEISRPTLSTGTISVAIPAGYDEIVIKGHLRSSEVAVGASVALEFNNDATATNYHNQTTGAYAGGTVNNTEANNNHIGSITAASGPANSYTNIDIVIPGPDTAKRQAARSSGMASRRCYSSH
jgi:hypothetical protein